jgi:hypothetical protein
MRNKLSDLNDHLFMQLERLGNEDLKPEALQEEIERTKAVTSLAGAIIANAKLALDAHIAVAEYGIKINPANLLKKDEH